MKYCFRIVELESLVWIGKASGDGVDIRQVRKRWRHLAMDLLVDGSWDRRRGGGGGGGGGEKSVWSLSKATIDDRHRGVAKGKSFASRTVREPYVDELLDAVDDIEEREVDDCMII